MKECRKYFAAMTMAVAVGVGLPTDARALTIGGRPRGAGLGISAYILTADEHFIVNHVIGIEPWRGRICGRCQT